MSLRLARLEVSLLLGLLSDLKGAGGRVLLVGGGVEMQTSKMHVVPDTQKPSMKALLWALSQGWLWVRRAVMLVAVSPAASPVLRPKKISGLSSTQAFLYASFAIAIQSCFTAYCQHMLRPPFLHDIACSTMNSWHHPSQVSSRISCSGCTACLGIPVAIAACH